MTLPFPKWCVAVLILPTATAAAQPPKDDPKSVVSRVLGMKPVPAGESDTPLRKLQRERFNARLAAAQTQAQAVRAGAAALQDLAELVTQLAADGADLEANPADRVKWFRLRVDLLREYEQQARARTEVGGVSPVFVHLATAARAEAEIDLLKLQESLKTDGKSKQDGK